MKLNRLLIILVTERFTLYPPLIGVKNYMMILQKYFARLSEYKWGE